MHLEGYMHLVT